jgi:ABC-type lipoprotein release transport system permease subunit
MKILVMLAFALISILYPLWQIWHIHPAEILRAGSSVRSGKINLLGSRMGGLLMPIRMLILRNLVRSHMSLHCYHEPLLIACGVIVLTVLVSALAILPAMRAVSRMEVVELLRTE